MENNILAMALGKVLKAKTEEYNTRAADAASSNDRETYVRNLAILATFDLIGRVVKDLAEMPPDEMLATADRMALSAHFSRLGGEYYLTPYTGKKSNLFIFKGREYNELPFREVKKALKEEGKYAV